MVVMRRVIAIIIRPAPDATATLLATLAPGDLLNGRLAPCHPEGWMGRRLLSLVGSDGGWLLG